MLIYGYRAKQRQNQSAFEQVHFVHTVAWAAFIYGACPAWFMANAYYT